MNELGGEAESAHRQVGADLAKYHVSHLIVVGETPVCSALVAAARERGIATTQVADVDHAAAAAAEILRTPPAGVEEWSVRKEKDVVLVKASNAAGLWRVADALVGPTGGARDTAPGHAGAVGEPPSAGDE